MRPGSGGRGRFRGGLGQDMLIESESKRPIVLSFMAERTRFPAPGLAGGGPGGLGDVRINGRKVDHRRQHVLEQGDRVLVSTPGGGGYGPAGQRPADLRARDQERGYIGPLTLPSPLRSEGKKKATSGRRMGSRGTRRRTAR
jgi:N-methylhydantoinase B